MNKGISSSEAEEKLKVFGYNEVPSARPKNIGQIAIEVIKEPMFLLLIGCGTLYIILGDYKEGAVILPAILLIISITFYQYRKTENALAALRKLASPRVLVIRDGEELRIPGREVVPGDVIILNEGDRVPADAEIIDSVNLTLDESILTGESIPVLKGIENNKKMVLAGTLVVQGKGSAEVLTTGTASQLGKIAVSLKGIEENKTRLQLEMKKLITTFGVLGIFISISVVAAFYFMRGGFLEALLIGLSSSMAILPEEFPVVLTVFLAMGAWRLSKKNVLSRKPSAIETLGSATVLCSDKTGTITQNNMEVAVLYNSNERVLRDAFAENKELISAVVTTAYRASQEDSADPMEKAFQQLFDKVGTMPSPRLKLLKEYPLNNKLKVMTRVYEGPASNSPTVFAKGAPEDILELCSITGVEREKHLAVVHQMAEEGYRVIGVANATHDGELLPKGQNGFTFQFAGLVGLADPIRPEVPQAIKECTEAGVKVIMITGDFPVTAKSIAQQIGLPDPENIISGAQLEQMGDKELREKIKTTGVFARVIPEQKLRIVKALKANGETVAMTGDGVNDAPALKAADIGVAMGNKGTDVAREAASLVLLDDNFASIVAAIRLGRKIYDNLQKAMSYILAIHIPIIGLVMLPAFMPGLPLLLLPLHIVFMELIIDPICSVAFESAQEERGIMKRPPRNPAKRFFGRKRIVYSFFKGCLLLVMVLAVYFLSINEGHTEDETRAIAFSSLIIGNLFLVLTDVSETRSFLSVFTSRNVPAIVIILIAIIVLTLVISVPALQQIFKFGFPGYSHFIPALSGAVILLVVFEIIKWMVYKFANK